MHYTQSGNLVNMGLPGFVSAPATVPASPNFALTAQSPAVDAGLPLAAVTMDLGGTPRPQGSAHDIGAYEFSVADAAAPASPAGLTVR